MKKFFIYVLTALIVLPGLYMLWPETHLYSTVEKIVVYKSKHEMMVFGTDGSLLKTYRVALGKNPSGISSSKVMIKLLKNFIL